MMRVLNNLRENGKSSKIVIALVVCTVLLGVIATVVFTPDQCAIVYPLLVAVLIFVLFTYRLKIQVRDNLFGELGFIYMAFSLAYTVLPALTFLMLNFDFSTRAIGSDISALLPEPSELGKHTWRLVLFLFGVATGYLYVRGNNREDLKEGVDLIKIDLRIIIVWISVVFCCIMIVTILSGPVTNYLDHYTRFQHLSWPLLRLVYIALIFKSGGYFVLIALLFCGYKRYKYILLWVVPVLCVYESVYSFGSRIETLMILLAVVCCFHYNVLRISLKKGILYLTAMAVIFSAVELFRSSDFSIDVAQSTLESQGATPASEFAAVYHTSFHLYSEREKGDLPPREWPMFINDLVAWVPFIDHTTYHPQYWYARNYFPDAVVPPRTMGVIADSAIWGGEIDLLIRSLINGALFAWIVRWFLKRKDKWWALAVYSYCYATCIMVLKYSVFYQISPLIKVMLPTLLLGEMMFRLWRPNIKDRSSVNT